MRTLSPGLTGESSFQVSDALTAKAIGSGDLAVLGTPALLALIEQAACRALDDTLPPEQTHVGATVHLRHLAPTKVGATVRGVVQLVAVEGKRLSFTCEAFEGDTLIGRAEHTRVIADRARFV